MNRFEIDCQNCSHHYSLNVQTDNLGKTPGTKCPKCGHIQALDLEQSDELTTIFGPISNVFGAKLELLDETKNIVESLFLRVGENVFGRLLTSQLHLNDKALTLHDPTVSKKHFSINMTRTKDHLKSDSHITIKDLNSLNGTFLNEKEVKPNTAIYLQNGDIITAGKCQLIFKEI